jgi:hypothetical protein
MTNHTSSDRRELKDRIARQAAEIWLNLGDAVKDQAATVLA